MTSWVIVNKITGRKIFETFSEETANEVREQHKDTLEAKPYPSWVCFDCGNDAQPDKRKIHAFATWHVSICDVCGNVKEVTEPRDFGYPEFK